MQKRFESKVVIITGASAGIGKAAALQFAAEGAQVVLAARGQAQLDAAVAEVEAAGGAAIAVRCDIADDAQCLALFDAAIAAFGGIDVLVNNAALHHRGPVLDQSAEALTRMVDVNLRSPVFMTRAVLPHLQARGGGAVIQVASLAGRVPTPGSATYSATKFGLRAFGLALNQELAGTGITISSVSPGPVDTGFIMDDLDSVTDLTMSQPVSTAAEVAEAILDCAADGTPERALPKRSALLTTAAYLLPGLARRLKPRLERKGREAKARIRAARK
ncbi:MAG: short-subunit dehydrogenase [Bradymonadia bacterium]|jgi:short-subunit dehydrogenase